MRTLPDFVTKLSPDIRGDTKMYIGSHIVLFKPKVYVTVPMCTQEDYHFFIPSTSTPPTTLDNKEIMIDGNRFAAINTNCSVALLIKDPIMTKEYASLSISSVLIQDIASQMGFHKEVRFASVNNPYSHHIRQLIMMYEREMAQNPCKLVDDSISNMLAAAILSRVKSNMPKRREIGAEGGTYADKAIAYMEAFFNANISLTDICHAVNISEFHFIRTFRQAVGKTPYEYLLDIRMRHAKELLRKGYPVAETARQCGFVSPAHFSTSFRMRYGMPPSQYKKRQ